MHSKRVSLMVAGVSILALGALLLPATARAQGSDRPLGIGVKGAWNLSHIRGEAFTDDGLPVGFSTGNGFSIGGLVTFEASPNVTIQPEFLYSRKKVEADLGLLGLLADSEVDTDWFEIPVVVKLHGRPARGLRPFALVGLTVSFLVSAEQSVSALGMMEVEDITDELTSTDVGLSLGGGVDFLQDWGVFTVDARYTLGLRSLDDEDAVKHDTFAVSGGFIF